MTAQTDRLEALLARVQENRQQPRGGSTGGSTDVYRAPAAAVYQQQAAQALQPAHVVPSPVYPVAQPAAPAQPAFAERPAQPRGTETRGGKSAATPLEMAVEGRLSSPSIQSPNFSHAQPQARTQPQAQAQQPQARAQVAASAAPVSHEGVVLVDTQIAQPTRSIAQVVSMNPPSLAATFGELLRRSLSLRPR